MSKSSKLPPQEEVNCLAHFCSVSSRLEAESFLGEDHHDRLSQIRGQVPKVQLEHPARFNSALALFRRLWMTQEPSSYRRVRNILYQYQPTGRYDGLRTLFWTYHNELLKGTLYPDLVTLSNEDTIDLWLNTQFAHGGKGQGVGRFTERDFDAVASKFGTAVVEFTVRMLVQIIAGGPYLNLWRVLGRAELQRYLDDYGLTPDFGSYQEHVPPTYKPYALETPLLRLKRLLKRQTVEHVRTLLRHVFKTPDRLLLQFPLASDLGQAIELGGWDIVQKPPDRGFDGVCRFHEAPSPWRSGSFVVWKDKDGGAVLFEGDGESILAAEFFELKRSFEEEQVDTYREDQWD